MSFSGKLGGRRSHLEKNGVDPLELFYCHGGGRVDDEGVGFDCHGSVAASEKGLR